MNDREQLIERDGGPYRTRTYNQLIKRVFYGFGPSLCIPSYGCSHQCFLYMCQMGQNAPTEGAN